MNSISHNLRYLPHELKLEKMQLKLIEMEIQLNTSVESIIFLELLSTDGIRDMMRLKNP